MADNSGMSTLCPSPEQVQIRWNNRFHELGSAFFSRVMPQGMPDPYWVAKSTGAAALLGLSQSDLAQTPILLALAGNELLPHAQPVASVYSGHQFGQWAGQLGDGRAILVGETQGLEIQLKGCGLTPYSRMGDGRAVLRSSIREFLASEAMAALGIPTTRALSVVGSDLPVRRETMETAAVVARLSPSFIRFGHFEHFASQDQFDELRQLADFVIAHHYPQCAEAHDGQSNVYSRLLACVVERTAQLMAHWQALGFCHGVMNTDNMSILGLTLDYGPFQFMDAFDPQHICNHSDHQGRYAFLRQPDVANWNLFCLGQSLMPLIEDTELALSALQRFKPVFEAQYLALMRAKLGLHKQSTDPSAPTDEKDPVIKLMKDILKLLAQQKVDYTIFWRQLSQAARGESWDRVRDLFVDRAGFDEWLAAYRRHVDAQASATAQHTMLSVNPKFVLRNHLAQQAIAAAQDKDYALLGSLQSVLEHPFDEHPEHEEWAGFPPDWAASICVSCSS